MVVALSYNKYHCFQCSASLKIQGHINLLLLAMENLFHSLGKHALSRFIPLLMLFCCSALPQHFLPLSISCKFYHPPSVMIVMQAKNMSISPLPHINIWVPVWPTMLSNSGKACCLKRFSPAIANSAQFNYSLTRRRVLLLSCILLNKVFFQSAQEQICSFWVRTPTLQITAFILWKVPLAFPSPSCTIPSIE